MTTPPHVRAPFAYEPIEEVTRTGVTQEQEHHLYRKGFMAADIACYDSHLIRKANAMQRLRAKHAQKYGQRDGDANYDREGDSN